MATLGDKKLPLTSPPAIPPPPTRNVPTNTFFITPGPTMTEEEIEAANEAERLAQEQDLIDAQAEEEASIAAMAALEGAFVPSGIFRHRGVGPLQYETKRGLIKVFPGDLVCHVVGPVQPIPEPPPDPPILDDDYIVVSEAVLSALLFTVDYKMFPDVLEYRAARIGEERRAVPPDPPVAFSALSTEELAKLSPIEREAYAQKQKDAQERARRLPPKPTQLPAKAVEPKFPPSQPSPEPKAELNLQKKQ